MSGLLWPKSSVGWPTPWRFELKTFDVWRLFGWPAAGQVTLRPSVSNPKFCPPSSERATRAIPAMLRFETSWSSS